MKKNLGNLKIVVAGALVLALVLGLALGAKVLERAQQRKLEQDLLARSETVNASTWTKENTLYFQGELFGFDHRLETFLFVGTDNSGTGEADPTEYHGPMADFLLLMVLDHTRDTIGYIQIDRNTVTEVNELNPEGEVIATRDLQITTAHWYGRTPEMAAENTVNAVRNYLGELETIDGYFVMSMDDIGLLNHTVGGVEVTIEDDMDAADPTLVKGETLVLDDTQAERFLRARMSVGEGTNAERMARQRQYMASFFDKVREKTAENPKFGLELWDMLKGAAVSNMNGNDFSRIAQKLLKGESKGIHTIQGETKIGYILADGEPHEEFYADMDDLKEEMIDMFSLVPIENGDDEDEDDEDYEDIDIYDGPDDEEEDYGDEEVDDEVFFADDEDEDNGDEDGGDDGDLDDEATDDEDEA